MRLTIWNALDAAVPTALIALACAGLLGLAAAVASDWYANHPEKAACAAVEATR